MTPGSFFGLLYTLYNKLPKERLFKILALAGSIYFFVDYTLYDLSPNNNLHNSKQEHLEIINKIDSLIECQKNKAPI